MYLIGTEAECQAYLDEVNAGENYQGETSTWDVLVKKPDQLLWAVKVHDNYHCGGTCVESITNWF